jgi:hypothetical protein
MDNVVREAWMVWVRFETRHQHRQSFAIGRNRIFRIKKSSRGESKTVEGLRFDIIGICGVQIAHRICISAYRRQVLCGISVQVVAQRGNVAAFAVGPGMKRCRRIDLRDSRLAPLLRYAIPKRPPFGHGESPLSHGA